MATTTYLLGAGASASKIPTVDNLNAELNAFKGFLQNFINSFPRSNAFQDRLTKTDVHYYDILYNVIDDLTWLYDNSLLHSSIDTFAKKLFLKEEEENLEKLKSLLSFYFSYKQNKNNIDLRYDNFFASILQRTINDFPKDLRIVSWNYDNQLEFAFGNFCDNDNIPQIRSQINLISKDINNFYADDAHRFGIFKLNGSAGLLTGQSYSYFGHIKDYASQNYRAYDELFSCLESYYHATKYFRVDKRHRIRSAIEFAWEKDIQSQYFELLEKSLVNTNALVVIGYSFPFFNREIDKFLLNECMPGLLKVYIQDLQATAIRKRIESIRAENIFFAELYQEKDNKQFIFPPEMQL